MQRPNTILLEFFFCVFVSKVEYKEGVCVNIYSKKKPSVAHLLAVVPPSAPRSCDTLGLVL